MLRKNLILYILILWVSALLEWLYWRPWNIKGERLYLIAICNKLEIHNSFKFKCIEWNSDYTFLSHRSVRSERTLDNCQEFILNRIQTLQEAVFFKNDLPLALKKIWKIMLERMIYILNESFSHYYSKSNVFFIRINYAFYFLAKMYN